MVTITGLHGWDRKKPLIPAVVRGHSRNGAFSYNSIPIAVAGAGARLRGAWKQRLGCLVRNTARPGTTF